MSVYFIVNSEITDPEGFDQYRAVVRSTFEGHDCEFLVSTNTAETIEGSPSGSRAVVIRFADAEAFRAWYDSDRYQAVIGLRLGSTAGFAILAEGH
jgi:uncharacterized protein (DUF1330 family)